MMQLGLTYGIPAQIIIKAKFKKEIQAPFSLSLFGLIRFIDNNYTNDLKDRKSVMGNGFFIYRAIVS